MASPGNNRGPVTVVNIANGGRVVIDRDCVAR